MHLDTRNYRRTSAFVALLIVTCRAIGFAANCVPVCTAPDMQRTAAAVPSTNGKTIIVWRDDRIEGTGKDIFAQCIDSTGAGLWAHDGVPVCTDSSTQGEPMAVTDGAGGAIVVWADYRNGVGNSDVFAQRIDSNGVCLWTDGGAPVCTTAQDQTDIDVAADDSGGVFIVWEDERLAVSHTNIFAQRIGPDGALSWGSDGIAICDTSINMHPKVISDGDGGAIIVWDDGRSPMSGTNYDIYAQRVGHSGTKLWTPSTGVQITDAENGQVKPAVAPDGSGGAIIIWEDHRPYSNSDDIYGQRVGADGTVLWAADDVPVCTADGYQNVFDIITDTDSGAIVVWEMQPPLGLFAQRFGPDGDARWSDGGVPVIEYLDGYTGVTLAADGLGGAIVAWSYRRADSTHYDLYAQRLNPSGAQLWPSDGLIVSNAPSTQGSPALAPTGDGGVVIAWDDYRDGSTSGYDIYTQGVGPDGELRMAPPTGAIAAGDARIGANPVTTQDAPVGVMRVFALNGVCIRREAPRGVPRARSRRRTAGAAGVYIVETLSGDRHVVAGGYGGAR